MLVSVQDIAIRVGERTYFEHTCWDIERGEHWAILGPTGAGKSVLGRALARQLPLAHGQILYFFDGPGRPYLNRHEVAVFSAETHREFLRQFAGYYQARWQSFEGDTAPTAAGLLEHQSLFAQSPYEILPQGEVERFRQKREEIIALFGLEPLLGRKVHLLSHGEGRKVFLARLLLRSPRLLILDDPLTGLDEGTRRRWQAALETLLERQEPAILLITSHGEEIPARIGRVLVVEEGRVVAQRERGLTAQRYSPARPDGSHDHAALDGMVEQYAAALREQGEAHPGGPALVKMENVSVAYGETEILSAINWTVRQGERWALLGANGAGKSTLLSLILADNPQAYRNAITLFGRRRGSGESIWEIKRRIGWVSPELHIFYEKTATCRDVVASGFFDSVGLYHQATAEQSAAVDGWMRGLGIFSWAAAPFETLSSGQQRMALLARALVKNPPLLVLDEPCQGLDDDHHARFVQMVDEICDRVPITLIYVTHYREELPAAITHCLRLERGRVLESGPLPEC